MKSKLAVLLGFIAEMAVLAAISESIIFDNETQIFLTPALIGLLIAGIYNLFSKTVLLPSVLFSIIFSILAAFQTAVIVSRYWHQSLISGSDCLLSSWELSTLILTSLFMLSDILLLSKASSLRGLKIFIYLLSIIFSIQTISTAKSWSNFICPEQAHEFLPWGFFLLILLIIISLLTKKKAIQSDKLFNSLPALCLSGILITSFLLALTQAFWQIKKSAALIHYNSKQITVSEKLIVPLLVAEDPIFFRHGGIDYSRLQEAVRETLVTGKYNRGGSTLSMQLYKLISGDYEKTIWRKFVQTIGAKLLEYQFSKQAILNLYLQTVPFAPAISGVQKASEAFFNSSPDNLDSTQSYLLVLSIYDPGNYNAAQPAMPKEVKLRLAVIQAREKEIGASIASDVRIFTKK